MNKGILYQKTTQGEEKKYLPIDTLKMLIWECHIAYGHTGANKSHKIIKEHFYQPHMAKIIRQILRLYAKISISGRIFLKRS